MVRRLSQPLVPIVIVKDIFGVEYSTCYSGGPCGCWPELNKEEREEWVVVKNVDSSAASKVTGQGTSKKQSSQVSIRSKGASSYWPGQLERFTGVGNLGELAQLQQLPARAYASKNSENSSSQSSGSQKKQSK